MEFPVITSEEHSSDVVRERLLLHWVNSLPLTKCLLVEDLRDLRFGDVLLEIVTWLQCSPANTEAKSGDGTTEDVFENGEIKERLRRVVQFAASECRSQDGDAMYIVNDFKCVTRVMAGQSDAICAVLTVLKRLGIQHLREQQSFENDKSAIRRLQVQEEMMKHSLHANDNADKLVVKATESAKQVQSASSRSQSGPHHLNTKKLPKGIQDTGTRTTKTKEKKRTRKRPTVGPKRKLKDKDPPSHTTANSSNINDKKADLSQTGIFYDEKGLRVYGMLDPSAKYQSRGETFDGKCGGCPSNDDEVAVRICNWIQLVLQIEVDTNQIFIKDADKWRLAPPRKVRQVFANGVLLRRIAAAIIQRCGKQLKQHVPEPKDLGVGASASLNDPQTPAERRRNLSLALAAFKSLGISLEALTEFESLQSSRKMSPKSIWSALDEVFNGVERLAHAAAPINTQHSEHSIQTPRTSTDQGKTTAINAGIQVISSPKQVSSPQLRRKKAVTVEAVSTGCVALKRNMPYISSEQIQVVNEWLARVGFDLKKFSGRGVLQDPMRNGVLLCSLLTQVLKMGSFAFYKRPQTLSDMRENISAAFEKLGNFPHEQIPQCYLTPSAEQAVLIGDRQISYGLLWHIWQVSHKTRVVEPNQGGKTSPKGIHETRGVEAAERPTPVKPSPLLLDIPAVALAEQGKLTMRSDVKTHFQVELHDSFARRLAWDENDPSVDRDDDDVFPVPRAPFSSPVYNIAFYHESALSQTENEEKFDLGDDILPVHPHQRTISSPSQDTDRRAPRIGIEELSAAVVAPITASANLATSSSHGIPVMPAPDIQIKAQGEHDSTPAQESVEDILAWLKRLGIHLKTASSFHDVSAKLSEFQSGVLLCSIVEKVELMRCIPGITRPSGKIQLSKASSLHNISKALGILQQKKTIPLHLLRRANAIYAGDRDVILQLLVHIRKAYGHHHVPRRRSRPHSSAA